MSASVRSAGKHTVLVTGATGKQGGAVTRHLLADGSFHVRALTRHPYTDTAKALEAKGVEIAEGDLDDVASVKRALSGAWGAYSVQTFEKGTTHETEQGQRFATLAREAHVQHFVYSSVASADKGTGIPHFESKFKVEQTVRSIRFPGWTIVRPVWFMENVLSPWTLQDDVISVGLGPTTPLQQIAVDDIGRFVALAFRKPAELNGQAFDIAGDKLTMPRVAELLSSALGRKLTYRAVPKDEVRKQNIDYALMLEWFEREGYTVDIPSLEKRFGIRPLKFAEWAQTLAHAHA